MSKLWIKQKFSNLLPALTWCVPLPQFSTFVSYLLTGFVWTLLLIFHFINYWSVWLWHLSPLYHLPFHHLISSWRSRLWLLYQAVYLNHHFIVSYSSFVCSWFAWLSFWRLQIREDQGPTSIHPVDNKKVSIDP